MLILDKYNDEIFELIETVEAALDEAIKTLGRIWSPTLITSVKKGLLI